MRRFLTSGLDTGSTPHIVGVANPVTAYKESRAVKLRHTPFAERCAHCLGAGDRGRGCARFVSLHWLGAAWTDSHWERLCRVEREMAQEQGARMRLSGQTRSGISA